MDDMVKSWTTNDGTVFEHIPLEDVKVAYNTIEKDLKKVTLKTYSDWIPADVYVSLRRAEADLYMAYKDEYYVGFFVTTIVRDFGGEKILFVWVAYSNPKYDNTEAGFEFLETLSKELDTTEIEFHSSRSGWAKKAEAYGYMPVMQVFKKEV